jgi:hypothetical protein
LNEPFSPELNWDEEDEEETLKVKPLSFGSKSSSSRKQERGREERALINHSNVDGLLDDTLTAVEYWGEDLKKAPSRRRR